jgi:hypothetical protein
MQPAAETPPQLFVSGSRADWALIQSVEPVPRCAVSQIKWVVHESLVSQ